MFPVFRLYFLRLWDDIQKKNEVAKIVSKEATSI